MECLDLRQNKTIYIYIYIYKTNVFLKSAKVITSLVFLIIHVILDEISHM